MSDSPLALLCLLVATGCLVTMTVVVAMLARDVRALARRMQQMAPRCESLIAHTRQAMGRAEAMLARAEEALQHVGLVTKRACAMATDMMAMVDAAHRTTATWLQEHFGQGLGNGTGSRRSRRASRG